MNKQSKHTQWHFPTASEAADPLKAKQRLTSNLKKHKPDHSSSSSSQPPPKKQKTSTQASSASSVSSASSSSAIQSIKATKEKTSVAIIVPYRDIHPKQNRRKHLEKFIPHMLHFLSNQLQSSSSSSTTKDSKLLDYHIYIIEQSNDERKFNRGKLLNIGFDIAKKNKCRPKRNSDTTKIMNL